MADFIIKNAQLINEGKISEGDLLMKSGRIERITKYISDSLDLHIRRISLQSLVLQ